MFLSFCASPVEKVLVQRIMTTIKAEIPKTPRFKQQIFSLQLTSMVYRRFRNMLGYLHIETGLEVVKGLE